MGHINQPNNNFKALREKDLGKETYDNQDLSITTISALWGKARKFNQ